MSVRQCVCMVVELCCFFKNNRTLDNNTTHLGCARKIQQDAFHKANTTLTRPTQHPCGTTSVFCTA